MRGCRTILPAGIAAALCVAAARADAPAGPAWRAVPARQVKLSDPFWAPRMETNRTRTLAHCIRWCEKTGRIENFVRAGAGHKGGFQGTWFNDSDVYKVLEGASYCLADRDDPKLRKAVDDLVAKIAAAQQADGYLYCYHTLGDPRLRWKQIRRPARHELYCAGHLIEAGVGHFEATGERTLLDVAVRLADHVASVFGPRKRPDVPEHQGIELALIRLYRATGQERHLALARHFLEARGRAERRKLYGSYSQDHLPARRQGEAVGHAVRATYFYAGLADLAMETGDAELAGACRRLWVSATARKMYITGGVGASRGGEAFGADYVLPNESAYAETCAAIGLVFFAHRMLQLDGDARYADVMERALYNAVAAGVSLDGTRFLYNCPLASRGPGRFFRSGGPAGPRDRHRSQWFGCACCPSNVVRILPTIGGYVYTRTDRGVAVNLYVAGSAKLKLGAAPVTLTQQTDYPWDPKVKITVSAQTPAEFALLLRIPAWCRGAKVRLNGEPIRVPPTPKGYVPLRRTWGKRDAIDLDLPMPVLRVKSHPRVAANARRVALQRGPIVYCIEATDHGGRVRDLALPRAAALKAEHRGELLGGVTVITGTAARRLAAETDAWSGRLYRPIADGLTCESAPFLAVPFCAWDNRRPGAMRVWIPEDPALAEPTPPTTIASRATASTSHCWPSDTVSAVNAQIEPASSHRLDIPRLTWWDHRGTKEWVQYDFAKAHRVSAVAVYWFDDRATGHCRVPASWRLLWKAGDSWRPVAGTSPYATQRDQYNRVAFAPVTTKALRIEVHLQNDCSAGMLEWRVSE